MKLMIPAVPGIERLAAHIVQHPALAGLHAGLMDAGAEHVIVVAHDDAIVGIDDLALVALDVEGSPGGVELLGRRVPWIGAARNETVMGDAQKCAAQRVGIATVGVAA